MKDVVAELGDSSRRRRHTEGAVWRETLRRIAERDAAQLAQDQARNRDKARKAAERLAEGGVKDKLGAKGAGAGRLGHKMVLPAHTATSRMLKAVYPWITDPGLSVPGAYIGLDLFSQASFLFEPWELYDAEVISSPNICLIGEIGTGKSALMKSLILRFLFFGTRFSWVQVKPEYEVLCAVLGVEPLRLGPGQLVRMNPLAEIERHPDQSEQAWRQANTNRRMTLLEGMFQVKLGRPVSQIERSVLGWALASLTGEDHGATVMGEVSLPALMHRVGDRSSWAASAQQLGVSAQEAFAETRDLRLALGELVLGVLKGMFDSTDPRNRAFDMDAPGTVVDLSRVGQDDTLLVLSMVCSQSAMEAELLRPDAGHRLIGYDEAWKAMRFLPLLRRFQEQWKLVRMYGAANMLAFHRFTDLDAIGDAGSEARKIAGGLLEDSGIKIAYRQGEAALPITKELMSLTDTQTTLLRFLKKGVGLWKFDNRPYIVKHVLSSVERRIVDTDSRMRAVAGVDDISDEEWEQHINSALAA